MKRGATCRFENKDVLEPAILQHSQATRLYKQSIYGHTLGTCRTLGPGSARGWPWPLGRRVLHELEHVARAHVRRRAGVQRPGRDAARQQRGRARSEHERVVRAHVRSLSHFSSFLAGWLRRGCPCMHDCVCMWAARRTCAIRPSNRRERPSISSACPALIFKLCCRVADTHNPTHATTTR